MHVTVKEVNRKEMKEEPRLTEYNRGQWLIMNQRKRQVNLFIKECFIVWIIILHSLNSLDVPYFVLILRRS